jgi:cell division protease FtsH
VRDLVNAGFEAAQSVLAKRRTDLERGVEMLLTQETITVDDLPALRGPALAPEPGVAVGEAA